MSPSPYANDIIPTVCTRTWRFERSEGFTESRPLNQFLAGITIAVIILRRKASANLIPLRKPTSKRPTLGPTLGPTTRPRSRLPIASPIGNSLSRVMPTLRPTPRPRAQLPIASPIVNSTSRVMPGAVTRSSQTIFANGTFNRKDWIDLTTGGVSFTGTTTKPGTHLLSTQG